MDYNEGARNTIRWMTWSGFYSPEEVFEIVTEELYEPGKIDPKSAAVWVREESERKAREELNWPGVTDCDKLTAAFAELDAEGIIALENAGYERSDAMTEIAEIYAELGHEETSVVGYCFYHAQDLERAVQGSGLMFSFGDIDGDDARGVTIGERVVSTLARHGLAAGWNGTIGQRIEIPKIVWQRRYTPDTDD